MKRIPLLMASGLAALILTACSPPEDEGATPEQSTPPPAASVDTGAATGEVKSALPVPALLDAARTTEAFVVAGKCNIESADGRMFAADPLSVENKANAKVTGWLLSDAQGSALVEPVLRIESSDKSQVWQLPLQLAIGRDDLAANGSTPGFEAGFDATALPAGRYHLYLAFRGDAGLMACDNGRHIELR